MSTNWISLSSRPISSGNETNLLLFMVRTSKDNKLHKQDDFGSIFLAMLICYETTKSHGFNIIILKFACLDEL
ncbi:hypothetical protein BpHYR1_016817 [Brachionus plicatilis]|uniref:Uncharacterized protein n=1 Tax=Brachionus plicatilis TaxID=10195 RepID=A0A3M7PWY2_BRAPC|nr:hypothetical protein BpHYR1_016817 [Brachionus plicatilis]